MHDSTSFSTIEGSTLLTAFDLSVTQITVHGEAAHQRFIHLNQHSMMIRLDKLEYVFQWTKFVVTVDFKKARNRYVTRTFDDSTAVDIDMFTLLIYKRTMNE